MGFTRNFCESDDARSHAATPHDRVAVEHLPPCLRLCACPLPSSLCVHLLASLPRARPLLCPRTPPTHPRRVHESGHLCRGAYHVVVGRGTALVLQRAKCRTTDVARPGSKSLLRSLRAAVARTSSPTTSPRSCRRSETTKSAS